MKPLIPFFSGKEIHLDLWLTKKLPVGLTYFSFTQYASGLNLALPVFEKEGWTLTFLDYSGELQVRTGRAQHYLPNTPPGTGILSSAGERVMLQSPSLKQISVLMILIPADWAGCFMQDNANFKKPAKGAQAGESPVVTAKLSRKQMPLLSAVAPVDGKNEDANLLETQNQILLLMEYFFCHCHKNSLREEFSATMESDEDISLIREVETYISEYYCSDTFTVDAILKKTYTSYHKLNFLFKSFHGMTISEYIRNKRIERSKEMIADNAKSISQIAYEIGYSSISNYILAFKKIYSITPGKYKKQLDSVA